MGKKCSCDNIQGFDSNGAIEGATNVAAGYGGFWLGEELTQMATDRKDGIEYFKKNPETANLILGGGKVGAAVGLPMAFPTLITQKWQIAALIGFGISGTSERRA